MQWANQCESRVEQEVSFWDGWRAIRKSNLLRLLSGALVRVCLALSEPERARPGLVRKLPFPA